MKIRVIGHSGADFYSGEGAWGAFFDYLSLHSTEFIDRFQGGSEEVLIAHKHSEKVMAEAKINKVPKSRRILVFWEPRIVDKTYYDKKILREYGHFFAPSKNWLDEAGVEGEIFNWPQAKSAQIEPFEMWRKRKKAFVIIQGNKFSARKGELYSLRRRVIKSKTIPIDLYGKNWNEGIFLDLARWVNSARKSNLREISFSSIRGAAFRYENYMGEVISKQEILSKYRYSIVIENQANYVSEKLFDSVSAGCATLYLGQKLSKPGINLPDELVLENNVFLIEKICGRVLSLDDEMQYELASKQNNETLSVMEEWQGEKVLKSLAKLILSKVEQPK